MKPILNSLAFALCAVFVVLTILLIFYYPLLELWVRDDWRFAFEAISCIATAFVAIVAALALVSILVTKSIAEKEDDRERHFAKLQLKKDAVLLACEKVKYYLKTIGPMAMKGPTSDRQTCLDVMSELEAFAIPFRRNLIVGDTVYPPLADVKVAFDCIARPFCLHMNHYLPKVQFQIDYERLYKNAIELHDDWSPSVSAQDIDDYMRDKREWHDYLMSKDPPPDPKVLEAYHREKQELYEYYKDQESPPNQEGNVGEKT